MGIIPIFDKESQKTRWVNSSFLGFRKRNKKHFQENTELLKNVCKKYQIDYVSINTQEDYVTQLIHLFKKRNKTWKRNA